MMYSRKDIEDLLRLGMTFSCVDFTPDSVRTESRRERPQTHYERYLEYIENIAPMFSDFGDGWGGDPTPREMAMKLYPYDEWDG